jgi:hypothetical protein
MNEDRSAAVTIGGQEYRLLLTMGATREICAKYGDIAGFGKAMFGPVNIEGQANPEESKTQAEQKDTGEQTKPIDFLEQSGHVLWMLGRAPRGRVD